MSVAAGPDQEIDAKSRQALCTLGPADESEHPPAPVAHLFIHHQRLRSAAAVALVRPVPLRRAARECRGGRGASFSAPPTGSTRALLADGAWPRPTGTAGPGLVRRRRRVCRTAGMRGGCTTAHSRQMAHGQGRKDDTREGSRGSSSSSNSSSSGGHGGFVPRAAAAGASADIGGSRRCQNM